MHCLMCWYACYAFLFNSVTRSTASEISKPSLSLSFSQELQKYIIGQLDKESYIFLDQNLNIVSEFLWPLLCILAESLVEDPNNFTNIGETYCVVVLIKHTAIFIIPFSNLFLHHKNRLPNTPSYMWFSDIVVVMHNFTQIRLNNYWVVNSSFFYSCLFYVQHNVVFITFYIRWFILIRTIASFKQRFSGQQWVSFYFWIIDSSFIITIIIFFSFSQWSH